MCETTSGIKLHLGCGRRFIKGFVHIDAQPFDHIDHVGTVAKLDGFSDNSVDLIYACHVLEHFGRHDYLDVLNEWRRVLRKGGILRLSVPDFEKSVEVYQRQKHLEPGMEGLWGALVGGQNNKFDYHKTVFDHPTLERSLLAAGFSATRIWDWRKTEHSHVDDHSQAYWPHMEKEKGLLMSLNMEAVK